MNRLVYILAFLMSCSIFVSCSSDGLSDSERIEKEILSRVHFIKSYDTYTCTYNFESTLADKYSPDKFKYCVEFGTESDLSWIAYGENSSLSSFPITLFLTTGDNWATFSFYMKSLKSIENKMANGGSLSSEEKSFYNNLKRELNKLKVNGFISRAYVEFNEEKYYLE